MDAKTLGEGAAIGEPPVGALTVESVELGGSSGSTMMSGVSAGTWWRVSGLHVVGKSEHTARAST
eukprot:4932489-Pleurochrysis_carterae.AAC.1